MASNLELRLQRLERQHSDQLRQQSAPVLTIEYIDAVEGQPIGEPCAVYEVAPRIGAANRRRSGGNTATRIRAGTGCSTTG
jgi:hypothetical protein